MRKDSPLAEHSCIHLNDLMDIPLILSRQAMGEEMPKWFGEMQDQFVKIINSINELDYDQAER